MQSDSKGALPEGYIPVGEAVKLIEKHTKENPTVDMLFLIDNARYVVKGRSFTIKRLQKNKDGKIVQAPSTYVHPADDYERALVRKTIQDKFKELTGRDIKLEALGLHSKSTAIVDEGKLRNGSGRPIENPDGIKLGDTINSNPNPITTNQFGA